MKFGRQFKLTIETRDEDALIIESPFTVEFSVVRSTMSSLNTMQAKIYGLSKTTRNQIFQDRFDLSRIRKVIFQAGYDELSTLFIGDLFKATSYRSGHDIVTFIDARDGGADVVNANTFTTIAKDTSRLDIVKKLIADMPNLKEGTLSGLDGSIRRGAALDGNTFSLLKKYTDDRVYIDLETVNSMKDDEVIEGDVVLLNSDAGLLGTPKRQNAFLNIDTLFEPRIIMSQLIEIKSDIQNQYDGQYKVIGVTHSGIISGAMNGNCKSQFALLVGSQLFGEFTQI